MAGKLAALWILFCLTLAAWEDLRHHRAANGKLLLALPALAWMHTSRWLPSALIALGAFWMWHRGVWGGADAKWAMLLAFADHTWGFLALLAAPAAALTARLTGRPAVPGLPWMWGLSVGFLLFIVSLSYKGLVYIPPHGVHFS